MKILPFLVALCQISLGYTTLQKQNDIVHPIGQPELEDQEKVFGEALKIARYTEKNGLFGISEKTEKTLERIIDRAELKLREKGHSELANKVRNEWETQYRGVILKMHLGGRYIGEFEPMSEWLSNLYQKLVDKLGEDICKALHLDDIHIINHTVPVVFRPCRGPWEKPDYEEHFSALLGVVGYWGVFIGCMIGTSGIGSFFCSPAGMGAELLLNRFLGPPVARGIYRAICE